MESANPINLCFSSNIPAIIQCRQKQQPDRTLPHRPHTGFFTLDVFSEKAIPQLDSCNTLNLCGWN
jgi:hypothetical protein